MNSRSDSLLRLVEERLKLKREIEESQKKQEEQKKVLDDHVVVPYLPEPCNFNINIRLPLETLVMSRFVCKEWYGIVNSPIFVDAHLQRSETGLIYLAPDAPSSEVVKASTSSSAVKVDFSVESKVAEVLSMPVHHWNLFNPLMASSRIKFVEIKDGKSIIREYNATCNGRIRAACNGLIVLEINMKRGGLVLLNPVTKELNFIPCGTMSRNDLDSYGLVYCKETSRYKLVHLFHDAFNYFDCEIMDIGSESWRAVDGPSNDFFRTLVHSPVFAIGALHWIPRPDQNDYIVSMPLSDEKFRQIQLPNTARAHDRILEMGECLGFVNRESLFYFDVWILRSLSGQDWEKQFSISVDSCMDPVPLFYMRVDGKLVFKCMVDGDLYVYDHHMQVMRKIEVNKECYSSVGSFFPHFNSLISWRS